MRAGPYELRVYAFDRALVRTCERAFPKTAHAFRTDPAAFVINHYTPIWELPFFADALRHCDNSAACALRRALDAQGHDGLVILGGRALVSERRAQILRFELSPFLAPKQAASYLPAIELQLVRS